MNDKLLTDKQKNVLQSFWKRMLEILYFYPIEGDTLYHYTSPKGLIGILQEKKLWLSESMFLNDPMEGLDGKKVLEKYVKNNDVDEKIYLEIDRPDGLFYTILRLFKNPDFNNFLEGNYFLISFSEYKDQLNQWRSYANDASGYSIGFNTHSLIGSHKYILTKVIYNENEKLKILDYYFKHLKNILYDMKEDSADEICDVILVPLRLTLNFILRTFKNETFADEKEWRLISFFIENSKNNNIKFRESRLGIIPYLELDFNELNIKINKVICGPKLNFEINKKALLLMNNHEEIGIEKSKCYLQ